MVDSLLLRALAMGYLPEDPIERLRVVRRMSHFRIDE